MHRVFELKMYFGSIRKLIIPWISEPKDVDVKGNHASSEENLHSWLRLIVTLPRGRFLIVLTVFSRSYKYIDKNRNIRGIDSAENSSPKNGLQKNNDNKLRKYR